MRGATQRWSEVASDSDTDLRTEVEQHKDIPTASTCARTIYLPVFAEEERFLQKLDTALDNFKAQQSQRGGAEFSYQ